MAIIVKINPSSLPLEDVARHRAKLCHGVAKHEETKFIANPNPPNTHFEVTSYTPRDQRAEKGLQEGHAASIPPQNFSRPKNASLSHIQHTPTYASAHFDVEIQSPPDPSMGLPLDLDDPEVFEGKLEIEKVMDDLYSQGWPKSLID
jgi:hypothetical protein